jgi:hypothetical protein
MIGENKPVDDDKIRRKVEFDPPLTGIEETATEWLLGQLHVGKTVNRGGTSWRASFSRTSRFYKREVALNDGTRVIGVVLRMCDIDDPPGQAQLEYLAGWTPVDRESEVDGWIAFLNTQITLRISSTDGLQTR